jgi:hypothetical protein
MAREARKSTIAPSDYIRKHPEMTLEQLVQAGSGQGLKITPALVNTVRYFERGDGVVRRRGPQIRAPHLPRKKFELRVSPWKKEAEFARLVVELGVDRARQLLAEAERGSRKRG